MISITFNKQIIYFENTPTLNDFLILQGFHEPFFAITVNQHFIPRAHYATTLLNEGDFIEMITPMQGG